MPHTLDHPAQHGDQASVLVGDDQLDTVQAALLRFQIAANSSKASSSAGS